MENTGRKIGEISYFFKNVMKTLKNISLLNQYVTCPPYTDYFHPKMREFTSLVEFEPGEYVARQDVLPAALYLMVSGRCCVRVLLANGKSVILRTLKAPCLIGEMELIREVSSLTVQALENCRMLSIPMASARSLLLGDPYFLRRLCSDLINKERTEALSLIHAFGYPLENRLAAFILDNRQDSLFLVKKVYIAESLGVSYRHVEKVMSDFVKAGYLSKRKLTYTILDEEALGNLARELDGEPVIVKRFPDKYPG